MPRPQHSDLDFQNIVRPINLPNAQAAGDAVPLGQMKALLEGNSWKDSARAASTGNLNLAAPGATIDGVAMAASDRVLIKDQATLSQNGIYVWNGAAVAITRAEDASTFAELESAVIRIEEGTANTGTKWAQTQVNGTLDTSNIVWISDSSSAPAASETTSGIAELATQAETDAGTSDTVTITPLKLANSSGRKRKTPPTPFGDGSATTFNFDHNFNTRDLTWSVYKNSGSFDEVGCDVLRPTVNRLTVVFAVPPAANAFAVVIIA